MRLLPLLIFLILVVFLVTKLQFDDVLKAKKQNPIIHSEIPDFELPLLFNKEKKHIHKIFFQIFWWSQ